MNRTLIFLTLAATVFPIGCHNDQSRGREIIIEPDLSASIDKQSQQQMFAAITDAAIHLRRGDSLTIIPITGDAEADLQGRTLHYEAAPAEKREAYDADLRKLSKQVESDLSILSADAAAHPGAHTDIIGSIRVAMKEFTDRSNDKQLIVLSDFIQDDQQFNFRKDPRLANEAVAVELAKHVMSPNGSHSVVHVVLGRLRSKEFSALALERQRAINAFWGHVMSPATIDPDGTALALQPLSMK